jgi:hypothetical protein
MSVTPNLQNIETLENISPRTEKISEYDASPSSTCNVSDIERGHIVNKIEDLNVVGDAMVYTNNGLYKISDLVGKEVEIWSGCRWFKIFVYIGGNTDNRSSSSKNPPKIQKITMCNGSCLKCTENQIWAIVDRHKIIPVSTNNLEIDMRVPTYQLPDSLSGEIMKNAYDVGKQIGKLFITKQHFTLNTHIQLPGQIYKLCPQSLGRFIAGWMDSQNNNIYGNYSVIHDLQLLLARIHIYISYIVKKSTYYMLEIPDKTNIPNPNNQIRESNKHIKNNKLYISAVETIPSTQKIYTIQNLDPRTKTIVLDGVLAIISSTR